MAIQLEPDHQSLKVTSESDEKRNNRVVRKLYQRKNLMGDTMVAIQT